MEFDAEQCTWQCGDIVVDPLQRRLVRRGAVLDIEERAFDLIVLLATHRGRAVDRREITAALWRARPVSENTLRQVVYKARRALGDDGSRQAVIRTVRGRSLRWVAPIVALPNAVGRNASEARNAPLARAISALAMRLRFSPRWLAYVALNLSLGGALAGGISSPRVAILPFENATGDANLDWARHGLPGLLSSLLEADDVRVVDPHVVAVAWSRATGAQRARRVRETIGATAVVDGRLGRSQDMSYELDLEVRSASHDLMSIRLHGQRPAELAAEAVPKLQRALQLTGSDRLHAARQIEAAIGSRAEHDRAG